VFARNEEEAVSPVIGVILMVAIVVILAAVIAAFVFGMAGSTSASKNVGMTVSPNGTDGVTILWQGGTDINSLNDIALTLDGNPDGTVNTTEWVGGAAHPAVGEITPIGTDDVTGKRVIIIGTFSDGSNQVIFDRRY